MRYLKISQHIQRNLPKKSSFEFNRKQIESIQSIAGIALAVLGAAGVVALSAIAPNIFTAIGSLAKHRSKRYTHEENQKQTARAFYYLKRHDLVNMKVTQNEVEISLTEKGRNRLQQLELHALAIAKVKRWNGRWWQVAADIPTKDYRQGADLLRRKLKELNFYPLQRTLWFYPYDPRQEVEFIVQHCGIEQFVTMMEISKLDIDDETKLRTYFNNIGILK